MPKAGDRKISSLFGIKAKLVHKETEEFILDRVYHTWIYEVFTGIKLSDCIIELPRDAESINVINTNYSINLQPNTPTFLLKRHDFPYWKKLELTISFVTRPRLDHVISYEHEEVEVGEYEWIRVITIRNKQNYDIKKIRLERLLDFEPSAFKVEELMADKPIDITQNALLEVSKDNIQRTARAMITWETHFSKLQTKLFKLQCRFTFENSGAAAQITSLVTQCNLLFGECTSVEEVFRESMQAAIELHTPCRSEKDFAHKIGIICQLFDVKLAPLRKILQGDFDLQWGSIKLIGKFLEESGVPFDSNMIQTWRNIVELRNASPPFHKANARVVRLCEYFGQNYPPNYLELWRGTINKFKSSLEAFVKVLQTIREKKSSTRSKK